MAMPVISDRLARTGRLLVEPEEVAVVIFEAADSRSSGFGFVSGLVAKLEKLMRRGILLPEQTLDNMAAKMMGSN